MAGGDAAAKPRVLVVYWTFSKQTERVADVVAQTLEERGADVTKARIEFTDKRWAKRFEKVPMRFPISRSWACSRRRSARRPGRSGSRPRPRMATTTSS